MKAIALVGERPGALVSLNDRLHWVQANELRKLWQASAFYLVAQNRIKPLTVFPVTVSVTFTTKTPNQRRDPHNFTPTLKHLIDGFTMAGLWPDDDSKHVRTLEPVFVAGDGRKFTVDITWED